MGNLSVREAVKHFNVSRPTLQKALADGKVSGIKDESGGWQIAPAELARVYQPRKQVSGGKVDKSEAVSLSIISQPDTDKIKLQEELTTVKLELAEAKARAEERASQIEDLRVRLDAETAERRSLSSRLLPAPEPVQKRKRWLGLF